MSINGLLHRGVRSVLDEADATNDFADLLARHAMHPDTGEHLRLTLLAVPDIIKAMQSAAAAPSAPPHVRALFMLVMSYVLEDENLIPSHAGRPLLGLLDDVYVLHLAARELEPHLDRLDSRSISGGAQLLEQAIPRGIVTTLQEKIREAVERTKPPEPSSPGQTPRGRSRSGRSR